MKNMAGLPQTFTVQNFVEAFRGKPFGQWFMNSLILTVAAVFITGIIALLAGYAFAKMRFKGKKVLFNMIVPLMSVPPVVMIIPQFRIIKILGLVNTRVSVILIYIGIMLPMTIYLMRNFMKTVPDSLLEAAEIDGCSKRKALTKIMIPLSVPALITSSLVNLGWRGLWGRSDSPSTGRPEPSSFRSLPPPQRAARRPDPLPQPAAAALHESQPCSSLLSSACQNSSGVTEANRRVFTLQTSL